MKDMKSTWFKHGCMRITQKNLNGAFASNRQVGTNAESTRFHTNETEWMWNAWMNLFFFHESAWIREWIRNGANVGVQEGKCQTKAKILVKERENEDIFPIKNQCSSRTRMLTRMLMAQMSKTHGNAVTQHAFLKEFIWTVLYMFSPFTMPMHRRLWNIEEGGVQSVQGGV